MPSIGQFANLAKAAKPDDRARLFASPFLLVNPSGSRSDAEDGVIVTAVGVRLSPDGMSPLSDDRLVIPLVPGALNSTPNRLTLGRSSVCDIVLPFSEVSKVHAYLHRLGDRCEVEDAGSTNGTSVDGKPLKRGSRAQLQDHAQVSLGGLLAEYRSGASLEKEILAPEAATSEAR